MSLQSIHNEYLDLFNVTWIYHAYIVSRFNSMLNHVYVFPSKACNSISYLLKQFVRFFIRQKQWLLILGVWVQGQHNNKVIIQCFGTTIFFFSFSPFVFGSTKWFGLDDPHNDLNINWTVRCDAMQREGVCGPLKWVSVCHIFFFSYFLWKVET